MPNSSKENQASPYRLMAPGPVPLPPEVLDALAQPMIHHRTPEFQRLFHDVLAGLKVLFQTNEPVCTITSTGSGGMEAALVNTFSPGDEVAVINSGKFGERWQGLAKAYGLKVHPVEVPWGEAVPVETVAQLLEREPNISGLFCQACETSTGVAHPIRELAHLTKDREDILIVVDAITGVGAMEIPMDQWGLDVVVSGSQKALMLPTGLGFVALSKKAWKFYDRSSCPKYYFDLGKERLANQKGQTFFSSAVTLIRALHAVLKRFSTADLLKKQIERSQSLALATRAAGQILGLQEFAKTPAPALTAFKVPSSIDGDQWRVSLEQDYKVTVMGGQDHLKGKIIRIGHMGYITDEDMEFTLKALGRSLQEKELNNVNPSLIDKAVAVAKDHLRGKE